MHTDLWFNLLSFICIHKWYDCGFEYFINVTIISTKLCSNGFNLHIYKHHFKIFNLILLSGEGKELPTILHYSIVIQVVSVDQYCKGLLAELLVISDVCILYKCIQYYKQSYVTRFGKINHVHTRIENLIYCSIYSNGHTQALPRQWQYGDRLLSLLLQMVFVDPIKQCKAKIDPVRPLRGINKVTQDVKIYSYAPSNNIAVQHYLKFYSTFQSFPCIWPRHIIIIVIPIGSF